MKSKRYIPENFVITSLVLSYSARSIRRRFIDRHEIYQILWNRFYSDQFYDILRIFDSTEHIPFNSILTVTLSITWNTATSNYDVIWSNIGINNKWWWMRPIPFFGSFPNIIFEKIIKTWRLWTLWWNQSRPVLIKDFGGRKASKNQTCFGPSTFSWFW